MTQPSAPISRDTIVALSSAPGRAAVAVIRLSGPEAGTALAALCGALPEPRRVSLRTIRDPRTSEPIDRGFALWIPGPNSQTGENAAEMHLHGGRAVIAAALDAALSIAGVRMAEPGEFTRRAFLAGKLDLAEAEGLADLLAAETEAQRRQALAQSSGALSARIDGWRDRLVEAMALVEAGIDFSDESDVTDAARAQGYDVLAPLREEIAAALADTRAERLREGFRVAILGRPNAGKSSLLNALAQRDAAIVAAEPGTTRDVIEVQMDLGGLPVVLVDTAGLREARDAAEREGVRRASEQAVAADLVIWLEDAAARTEPEVPSEARVWRVVNKIDTAPAAEFAHRVSALTGEGLDRLAAALGAAAADALTGNGSAGLTRARHRDALAAALVSIDAALDGWAETPDEILAELLRRAADELGRITGRVGVEEVLGRIFSSFCIGK
ncbi:MAG: tRNA uridine-5-carboxymethylaminomethyl(34) synthesis GTPase MnmE [Hansschlegelia sp.]